MDINDRSPVDHMKVLYHFSSVHYKSLFCLHHMNNQRHGWPGCEFSPRGAECYQVPGADDRYGSSQSLRALPVTKCVFIHDEDVSELGCITQRCRNTGQILVLDRVKGDIRGEFEVFSPEKFRRGGY